MTSLAALAVSTSVSVSVLVSGAAPAFAEPIVDRKNHYQLDLPTGWAVQRSGQAPRLLTLEHRSGAAGAVLTRADFPNTPAWRRRGYYFDEVIAGLKAETPGFALIRQRRGRLGLVPYLDVSYRRQHDERPHVHVRFLFYRTFTLIATAASTRAGRRDAAHLVRSLEPPK